MAKRGLLENSAIRLYADGLTLEEIGEALGVSVTSLWMWKDSTKDPNTGVDEWCRAREQKQSNTKRLRDLFSRELEFVENQPKGSISAASMDALTKLGSLVKNWDAARRAEAAVNQVGIEVDRPAIFLENLEWIAAVLKEKDPAGLKVLADNFDYLIEKFKGEHAQTA